MYIIKLRALFTAWQGKVEAFGCAKAEVFIKIIIIVSSLTNGGSERVASILANSFIDKGHKVSIITAVSDKRSYEVNREVSVYNIKQIKPLTIFRTVQIVGILAKEKPDVVISFLLKECLGAIWMGIPLISSLRFDPFAVHAECQKKIMKYVFGHSTRVVYQTEMAKKTYGDLIKNNGYVIANPISRKLPTWELKDANKRFIAVGRLTPVKNFRMLIEAFYEFHIDNSQYSLEIYGRGEQKGELEDLINSLRADGYIMLKGFEESIGDVMSKSFAFCQTSNHEGLSNSMLEAMAVGIPVICTDCLIGGPREYIKDKFNGLLIPVGDKAALVEAMKFYAECGDRLQTISENARKIRELINEDEIFSKWEKLLKDVCGEQIDK